MCKCQSGNHEGIRRFKNHTNHINYKQIVIKFSSSYFILHEKQIIYLSIPHHILIRM